MQKIPVLFAHRCGWTHRATCTLRRPSAYVDALNVFNNRARPDADQRNLIKTEEELAWQHAEEELHSLGFSDWPPFYEAKRVALENYGELLRGLASK